MYCVYLSVSLSKYFLGEHNQHLLLKKIEITQSMNNTQYLIFSLLDFRKRAPISVDFNEYGQEGVDGPRRIYIDLFGHKL